MSYMVVDVLVIPLTVIISLDLIHFLFLNLTIKQFNNSTRAWVEKYFPPSGFGCATLGFCFDSCSEAPHPPSLGMLLSHPLLYASSLR